MNEFTELKRIICFRYLQNKILCEREKISQVFYYFIRVISKFSGQELYILNLNIIHWCIVNFRMYESKFNYTKHR